MNTLAIIQARMGSSRFPGKVLQPIGGKAILLHIVERLRAVPSINDLVVALPDDESNQSLRTFCREHRISFWAGSETDVLSRFHGAALRHAGDPVLRVTADCPLVDPGTVGKVIDMYRSDQYDYVSVAAGANAEGLTEGRFPDGLDAECCSFAALDEAWRDAADPRDREHVTRFLWRQPKRFRCGKIYAEADSPPYRLTVDHPLDLDLVSWIYAELGAAGKIFPLPEVIDLLARRPDMARLNQHLIEAQNYKALTQD